MIFYIAVVLPISYQLVPSLQMKFTQKTFAVVVPVESVAVVLKFVPHVSTKALVPLVVIINVIRAPAVPPVALNVQAPVGVILKTVCVAEVMGTVIVPVVADVEAAETPCLAARSVVKFVIWDSVKVISDPTSFDAAILPARSPFNMAPVKVSFE